MKEKKKTKKKQMRTTIKQKYTHKNNKIYMNKNEMLSILFLTIDEKICNIHTLLYTI